MTLERPMTSFGKSVVVLLAMGAAFASGCAGKSTGDDDEDGGNAGSSSIGGTAGAFGGTSSGQSNCVPACERVQMCPDAGTADCVGECRDIESEAAAAGCTAELRNFLTCVLQTSNLCDALVSTSVCDAPTAAYVNCLDGLGGGGGTGNCTSGVVTSADCTTLCQRGQACPDAVQTDCAAACSDQLAAMAELGCSQQYQAMLGCASTCTNICAVSSTDCAYEIESLSSCASG
jgi:hypothetical protein